MKQAKSAMELSRENHIPLSSTYKQIRLLEKTGLVLQESRVLDKESNTKTAYYRSKIQLLKIEMREDGLSVQLINNGNNINENSKEPN